MKLSPTRMLSPAAAKSLVTTPAASARTSTVTLSVSTDASTSSIATASPGFFIHSSSVPSLMESPMLGTG